MQFDLELGLGPAPEPAAKRLRGSDPASARAETPAGKQEPGKQEGGRERTISALAIIGGSRGESAAGGRILRVVNAVRPEIASVVFTRNRRVMISLTADRRVLRVHACFGDAPDAVIRAVATLFGKGSDGVRSRARDTIREFLRVAAPVAPVRAYRPRTRSLPATDLPYLRRLRAEFQRVNAEFFDGALPEVPLFLSRRMERRNGHFSTRPLEIVISRRLCTHAQDGEAENTLRHEMIHLWQHRTGGKLGHGPDFRRWARVLDVHPRATRPVVWKAVEAAGA
jgi:predicted SprT family Zn-dependent metalloprotease